MFSRTSAKLFKVTVLGASGGIGQPLSLLLKNSPLVSCLSCYDIVGTPGVAADLSHICTPAKVEGYLKDGIAKALNGADVVVIPAGVPRKPGMTREDLFSTNATIVRDLVAECAKYSPKAIIAVISNPVNMTIPIAAEVLKKHNVFDPRRLFGVTTLDIVRAKTFLAAELGCSPYDLNVPVVGGHSGATIVPLISQANVSLPQDKIEAIIKRVQFGGDEVVKAKAGAGSATLAMAFAGAEFTVSLLKALRGDKGIIECTFVESNVNPSTSYFSSRVELGKNGVEKILPVGDVTDFEKGLLEISIEELKKHIAIGTEFGKK
eukprot:Tbor_TRINITY_DN5307_c0_g1::TRINITY_DN5307_c0_g1_i6::g.5011::m.5011/K00026/MDH2; malate dehydrogenase